MNVMNHTLSINVVCCVTALIIIEKVVKSSLNYAFLLFLFHKVALFFALVILTADETVPSFTT